MTRTVEVQEAREQLSRLLDEVSAGTDFVIVENGRPVARLMRVASETRIFGLDEGTFTVPPDFDEPLPHAAFDSPPRDGR